VYSVGYGIFNSREAAEIEALKGVSGDM